MQLANTVINKDYTVELWNTEYKFSLQPNTSLHGYQALAIRNK